MVQLKILSGKKAGTAWAARHFPVRIGRSAAMDLKIEEDGVWDDHLSLVFRPADGVVMTAHENALVSVNATPTRETVLRNGDILVLGSARLQFWLSENRQAGLGFREALIWAGIVTITLAQVWLIYSLLRA